MSKGFDPGETPSYFGVSSGFKLFAYGIIVVSSRLRVKSCSQISHCWEIM